ncbi:hypothetical protein DBS38_17935 [Salmonella enterica]|nr:hypothetical protein [Salmonella enterica]EBE9927021.1 hypothetical protein [Salmonella enterica]HAE7715034.1 hypothetical protein [Salmonella enterica subsp. enterica]
MNPDIITIILSMVIFFMSFYHYARSTNLPLTSPIGMNEYFSGIFFLRKRSLSLFFGRIALLMGFPLSYTLRFIRDGEGAVYFPLIVITWGIALYFYIYADRFNGVAEERKGFFSILLKGKTYGMASTSLWLLRILYIASVIYVFLCR